jgi:predicted dehydrogenase
VKFLIAGLGSIGRRHLRNLIALGEEDIVLYRTGKSTLPDEELEPFTTEYSLDDALAHKPDAVIVSNPTALHLDVAIPAARAGCHLLIEKPISNSLAGFDDLDQALKEGEGEVLVGFQFRYHPTLQIVKRYIHEKRLGQVSCVRAHWGESLPDWHPWENYRRSYAAREDLGGGVLLTLCHPLDYLMWIFGDFDAGQGISKRNLGLEVEALVEAIIQFQSGILASVHLDYLQKAPEHTITIIGEFGKLRWNGLTGDLHMVSVEDEYMEHRYPPEGFKRNDLFLAEMRHFLKVIDGLEAPVCTLEQAIKVQRLIEMIRETFPR